MFPEDSIPLSFHNQSYSFSSFFLKLSNTTPILDPNCNKNTNFSSSHKNANKQKESSGDITIVYIKAEDEIFHEISRHYRPVRCLPLSFSPLARSMAQIASNKKVTHKVQNSRFPGNNLPSSSGGTMVNHGQINKSEDSRSSDGEEFYDLECMVDLKEPLLKACCQKDVVSKLSLFLRDQAKDVGLFVSQRVVNLPP
ncbi:hypothetical protein P3S67_012990 [Capsicum chacoense]